MKLIAALVMIATLSSCAQMYRDVRGGDQAIADFLNHQNAWKAAIRAGAQP